MIKAKNEVRLRKKKKHLTRHFDKQRMKRRLFYLSIIAFLCFSVAVITSMSSYSFPAALATVLIYIMSGLILVLLSFLFLYKLLTWLQFKRKQKKSL